MPLLTATNPLPGMEELAEVEEMVLAKGRVRVERQVENGIMIQEDADAEYEQVTARMGTGGLTYALALGTPHPAAVEERSRPSNYVHSL